MHIAVSWKIEQNNLELKNKTKQTKNDTIKLWEKHSAPNREFSVKNVCLTSCQLD